MKPEIHPNYHTVLFVDSATGTEWTTRSTLTAKETREIDGEEVPVVRLEISSVSHPFWTGKMRELDVDGKIERFRKRYGTSKKAAAAEASEAPAEAAASDADTEKAENAEEAAPAK
jgi:large subunit ribosomal protein L31